jgi:hypothetical protein
MGDTLSNLLTANHSASVLQGIMNPAQVNPLAALNSATQTAGGIYDLRQKQAVEAAGQAFQASIDPETGMPRQSVLMQNLAKDPRAAMAAQTSAQAGQTLDNNTLNTHLTRLTGLNAAAMALTAQYPTGVPQDVINAEIDRVGPSFGISPQQIAQAKASFGPDPVQNSRTIIRNGISNLSAQEALHASRPGATTINDNQGVTGAQIAPTASDQPGAVTPTGPTTPVGYPSREKLLEQVGQPITDPAEAKALGVPVGTIRTAPMVYRYQQQNIPATLTGPAGAKPAAPVPSPIPGGGVYKPPGAAAPAATPAAPAPAAPAAPAPTDTGIKPVVTSLPPGADKDVEAFKQAQFRLPDQQTQDQNLNHAYEALKLVTTGKGTENVSGVRNFLATVGLLPKGAVNDEALFEIARKYTERTIAAAGNAGGTDTARAVAAASNPNVSLINPANLAFIRNDIGKNRQAMAAVMDEKPEYGGVGFGDRSKDKASNTDYRGFNWDQYSPAEQAEIQKSVGTSGKAHDDLARAIGIGRRLWPTKAPVSAVPHGALVPAAPPPNMLAMAPQQNPLLAA